MIAVSVVSHGHGTMVAHLLSQLRGCSDVTRIVLTLNIPEALLVEEDALVQIIRNATPKGFGANHNAAFHRCRESYFCVLNPDIELNGNPFPALIECIEGSGAALAAPLIVSPSGGMEDNARHFPTVGALLRKAFGGHDGRYAIGTSSARFSPDWVAGMFMLFRSSEFAALKGFDESYYLYYEDVDICKRARLAGMEVTACPTVQAIHDARRASRRNLRHMRWHLASMLRYLWRHG